MTKKRPETPRQAAAFTLFAVNEEDAWSQGALDAYLKKASFSRQDAALATKLVYGVLQNRAHLDFYISHYSSLRLKKIAPRVLEALRLGAYQLLFLDKIPDNAAVNESVELVKSFCRADERTIRYVNAVLRTLAREKERLPALNCPTKAEYYSIQYSHPKWLVEQLIETFGLKEAAELLKANNEAAPTVLRVNPFRATANEILTELYSAGIEAQEHPKIENCILCTGTGNLTELPAFKRGDVTVQDGASQVCAQMLLVKQGETILDCCAAPGGKTFLLAQQAGKTGRVMSCDIYEHKLKKIEEGAQRLGLSNIAVYNQDAAQFRPEWESIADGVLCDVPCSGFGIIRKKPEIRYKDPESLKNLPLLQKKVLKNCARYVKPGGRLVYSTCTILGRENEEVVQAFLSEHPDFTIEPMCHPLFSSADNGMITLLPHRHGTDGFFIARLRRIK